ncbi:MAG: Cys-tRNA(Pro) deacylase, partial [Actinomycetales bacterium]|nr:Cys-tRNA(Pro) deacylase [Actinomycetales bacterium]
ARSKGGTPATVALERAGVAFVARSYDHDPSADSYGLEAAEALGVPPERVFKTLLVDTGSGLAVGIVPVDRLLDLKAIASALGAKKATMADPKVAERSTGYVVGGISPLGQRKALPTVLDATARDFETILVSGGKRGFDLELAPADLAALTRAIFADIAR